MTAKTLAILVLRFLAHHHASSTADVWAAAPAVVEVSGHYQLDPLLVAALIYHESHWSSAATGTSGEVGLMQTLPATARKSPAALRRPWANVSSGVRYMARCRRVCGGDPVNWLGKYNGRRCGRTSYGNAVLQNYREMLDRSRKKL